VRKDRSGSFLIRLGMKCVQVECRRSARGALRPSGMGSDEEDSRMEMGALTGALDR
jgi:hypothetical protein